MHDEITKSLSFPKFKKIQTFYTCNKYRWFHSKKFESIPGQTGRYLTNSGSSSL